MAARVYKMGREWWVRCFGSTTVTPAPFKTKAEAQAYANLNERAVRSRGVTDADEAAVVDALTPKPSPSKRRRSVSLSNLIASSNRKNWSA